MNERIRVLRVNSAANRGGASLSALAIDQAVAAQGVSNTFVVGSSYGVAGGSVSPLAIGGVQRSMACLGYRVFGREGMFLLHRWRDVLASLHDYQLVHLHNVHGYYMPFSVLELLLQKPCIWTLHDFWLATGGPAFPPLARGLSNWRYPAEWINRSARRRRKLHDMLDKYGPTLVAVSEDMLQRLRGLEFIYKNIQVVPHGLFDDCGTQPAADRHPQEPVRARAEGKLALLFVSAQVLNPLKGFRTLLAALDAIRGNVGDLDVVVVGEIPPSQATRISEAYPFIRFVGSLSENEAREYYRACDIYVTPTVDETYGRCVVEALAEGMLVVCSDLPVLREIGGNWPRFFEPGNAEALAATLSDALRSRDAFDRTTQAREIRKRYSLCRMGEAYVDLYRHVLRSRR